MCFFRKKFKTVYVICHREDDYERLRFNLGKKLDYWDRFYGEYGLAILLKSPGEGRVNLVPTVSRLCLENYRGFLTNVFVRVTSTKYLTVSKETYYYIFIIFTRTRIDKYIIIYIMFSLY